VTNVTDFGLFVELEKGIEGLIHVSQLAKDKQDNQLEKFQVKDEVEAEVVNVSQKDKRIGLSIRKLEENSGRDIYKGYQGDEKKALSSLGDLLKDKMNGL